MPSVDGYNQALIAGLRIPEGTSIYVDPSDGSPGVVDLTPASLVQVYFPTGDGSSSCLLQHVKTTLNAWLAGAGSSSATVDYDVGTDGRVSWGAAGANLEISWADSGANGTWWREILGYVDPVYASGLSLEAGITETATRVCYGSLYPFWSTAEDVPEEDGDTVWGVPEAGLAQVTNFSEDRWRRLTINLSQAAPNTPSWNEFTALARLLRQLRSGLPFRYYRDRTVTTAFAEVTNADGYHTLRADPKTSDLRPKSSTRGRWQYIKHDLYCRDETELWT